MGTINGVGTTYYGQDQTREDLSYVATSFFVVFFVPVIPLGTVRMRNLGIDGATNRYEIIERLPLQWTQVRRTYVRGWLLLPLVLFWPLLVLFAAAGLTHAFYGKETTSNMMSSVAPIVMGFSAIYILAMASHLIRRVRRAGMKAFPSPADDVSESLR